MAISLAGVVVILGLLGLGACFGSPIIIGLFGSLAFGATAIASLGAGGSSPLIYSVFLLLLFAGTLKRPGLADAVAEILRRHWSPWVVIFLAVYVAAGSGVLPRLLAGQTTAFVPIAGTIEELPLAPVPGNFTQTAYLLLGVFAFFAFSTFALERSFLDVVRRGFFVLVFMNVALGTIDLAGKIVGAGDILAPIRSANYAMLTDRDVVGFWRIAGGFSEASAFAGASVACLAFAFTYWRATGSRLALFLASVQCFLLVLSTSSTAYVSLAILSLPVAFALISSSLTGRFKVRDLIVVSALGVGCAVILALVVADAAVIGPFNNLINTMVFEKASSPSGVERTYFNTKSLDAFFDTGGLGIGMGSSRSSSWPISVLSQLGIPGALLMGALVIFVIRGMHGKDPMNDPNTFVLANSARAAALGSLVPSSIAGSGADPGLLFFIALAIIVSCRDKARSREHGLRLTRPISDAVDRQGFARN